MDFSCHTYWSINGSSCIQKRKFIHAKVALVFLGMRHYSKKSNKIPTLKTEGIAPETTWKVNYEGRYLDDRIYTWEYLHWVLVSIIKWVEVGSRIKWKKKTHPKIKFIEIQHLVYRTFFVFSHQNGGGNAIKRPLHVKRFRFYHFHFVQQKRKLNHFRKFTSCHAVLMPFCPWFFYLKRTLGK